MKRAAFAVSVAVLVFAVGLLAQLGQTTFTPLPKSGSAEQELMKLEQGWSDALVKHDLAFLDRIWADDYMSTSSEGIVATKAQEIASLKSGDFVLISTVLDDWKAHVYGDAAVCFGRSTDKPQLKGKDISGQYRWTDTWIKRGGRWQCVASHESKIAQK